MRKYGGGRKRKHKQKHAAGSAPDRVSAPDPAQAQQRAAPPRASAQSAAVARAATVKAAPPKTAAAKPTSVKPVSIAPKASVTPSRVDARRATAASIAAPRTGLDLTDGRLWLLAALGFILLQAIVLHLMGHVAICKCGTVKLWHGVVQSSENSQHLTDWYTFSHVLHGLLFYAFFTWVMPRASWPARLAAAVALEAGWEIVENTDFVINRYRTATVSLDYYGDSIVNSVMDNVAMIAGFLLARVLPVAASALLFVGLELFMLWAIRDNLTLNVLMLLWPVEDIAKWQAGG